MIDFKELSKLSNATSCLRVAWVTAYKIARYTDCEIDCRCAGICTDGDNRRRRDRAANISFDEWIKSATGQKTLGEIFLENLETA